MSKVTMAAVALSLFTLAPVAAQQPPTPPPDALDGVDVVVLLQQGKEVFGKSAAISALEEGEDHGNRLYENNLNDLSEDSKEFIRSQIMPEQRRTHDMLSAIEHQRA